MTLHDLLAALTARLNRAFARPGQKAVGLNAPWLFVLGVNNSGTTLLAKMLETHPQIRGLSAEGQLLTHALPRPDLLGVVRIWTEAYDAFRWTEADDPTPAEQAKRDWLRQFPLGTGYLLEKSPPNVMRARWLQENFRPSRFIGLARNPYAVCEGIRRRNGYSLERAARHWVLANQCLLDDADWLEDFILIRYEDMVGDLPSTLLRLQRFLGLQEDFEHDICAAVTAHAVQEAASGLHDFNAVSLARLTREELNSINAIAAGMMLRLGYEVV